MKNASLVKFLVVVLFLCLAQLSYGQKKFFNNSVVESLESGELPVYNDSIRTYFQERNESAVILYHLLVDTSGYVMEYKVFPLYNIGNELDSSSRIWSAIEKDINQKVCKWKFKPNLWALGDKKLQNDLNATAKTRPNGGYQTYLMLFHVNSDIELKPLYMDVFNPLQ